VQGSTGATGVAGATGVQGFTGASGGVGATGVGTSGATGPQGATGVAGSAGSQGATGVAGATGSAGATGVAGYGIRVDDPADTDWGSASADDYEFNGSIANGSTVPTNWSWVNRGTSTYREHFGAGRILHQAPASGSDNNVRGITRAVPSGSSWVAYCKLFGYAGGINFSSFGFGLSDGTKIMYFGPSYNASLGSSLLLWNSATSYNTEVAATFTPTALAKVAPYFRIQKISSSSYTFSQSLDGISWVSSMNYNVGGFLTPTTIGVFGLASAQNYALEMSCHWYRTRTALI
jgi:hypothetical protein